MSTSCQFFLCCVTNAGLFFSSIQIKLLSRLISGVTSCISVNAVSCGFAPDKCSNGLFLSIWSDDFKKVVPSVALSLSWLCLSLHCLLLLHCNKCTTFPYSYLNDIVITQKGRLLPPFGLWCKFPSFPFQFSDMHFRFFIFLSARMWEEILINPCKPTLFSDCKRSIPLTSTITWFPSPLPLGCLIPSSVSTQTPGIFLFCSL